MSDKTYNLEQEVLACLAFEPKAVRVCEGGGPESLAASLAITMNNVRELYQSLEKENAELKQRLLALAESPKGQNIQASLQLETANRLADELKAENDKLADENLALTQDCLELKRQFAYANMVLPAAVHACNDARKMLQGQPNWCAQSLNQFDYAYEEAKKLKAASQMPWELRHEEEKRDTATRLGYPGLEPWAAADIVIRSYRALLNDNKRQECKIEDLERRLASSEESLEACRLRIIKEEATAAGHGKSRLIAEADCKRISTERDRLKTDLKREQQVITSLKVAMTNHCQVIFNLNDQIKRMHEALAFVRKHAVFPLGTLGSDPWGTIQHLVTKPVAVPEVVLTPYQLAVQLAASVMSSNQTLFCDEMRRQASKILGLYNYAVDGK